MQWIYLIFLGSFVIKDNRQSTKGLAPVLCWIWNDYGVLWLSAPLHLLCDPIQGWDFKSHLFLSEISWLWVTVIQLNYSKQKWGFIGSQNCGVSAGNGSVKGLRAASAPCLSPVVSWTCFCSVDLILIRLWPWGGLKTKLPVALKLYQFSSSSRKRIIFLWVILMVLT